MGYTYISPSHRSQKTSTKKAILTHTTLTKSPRIVVIIQPALFRYQKLRYKLRPGDFSHLTDIANLYQIYFDLIKAEIGIPTSIY